MFQVFKKLILNTKSYEILNITTDLENFIKSSNFNNGLINVSILHTSCSLMIQENADQNVLKDITIFLKKLAPEDNYFHDIEGPDDMPAHLKSLVTQTHISLSFKNKRLILGKWQGVFLIEHRAKGKTREILFHLLGE